MFIIWWLWMCFIWTVRLTNCVAMTKLVDLCNQTWFSCLRFSCYFNCIIFSIILYWYVSCGVRSEPYNSKKFNEWVVQGAAPGFDASLKLYKGLKNLGFTIILLTGRDEAQRSITEKNLRDAGYSGWEHLLLRYKLYQNISLFWSKKKKPKYFSLKTRSMTFLYITVNFQINQHCHYQTKSMCWSILDSCRNITSKTKGELGSLLIFLLKGSLLIWKLYVRKSKAYYFFKKKGVKLTTINNTWLLKRVQGVLKSLQV